MVRNLRLLNRLKTIHRASTDSLIHWAVVAWQLALICNSACENFFRLPLSTLKLHFCVVKSLSVPPNAHPISDFTKKREKKSKEKHNKGKRKLSDKQPNKFSRSLVNFACAQAKKLSIDIRQREKYKITQFISLTSRSAQKAFLTVAINFSLSYK